MEPHFINDLAGALAKAQAEIQNPKFDSVNPHFKNKFASLAAVRNAIVPVFAKHGLSVLQNLTTIPEHHSVSCETIILHSSGQSIRLGPLVMPASKADAQGLGSAATYARRYSLLGVAGVAGEDDDDGNAASAKPSNGKDKDPNITEAQAADLKALIEEVGETEDRFLRWAKVNSLQAIPASFFKQAVAKLEAKRGTAIQ
jgi:hypothetical protein